MEIAEFLLARIAEDEAVAREAADFDSPNWIADGGSLGPRDEPWHQFEYLGGAIAGHAARWDPARVLAECETKRRIVEFAQALWDSTMYEYASTEYGTHQGSPVPTTTEPGELLRLLALPYADHPEYRAEWALEAHAQ